MSEYNELKRLAEHHQSLGHTYTVVTPDAVLALIAENEALRNQVQSMIDQTTPLVPVPGDPGWSRRITIDELQAKAAELRKDAELGKVATRYIDRLCDPTESDSLWEIVDEYAAAFRQAMSKEG